MNLPKEAELIGTNDDRLEIEGAATHTVVRLTAKGQRKLVTYLDNSGERSNNQVYVILENIRGTRDASVLSVYINLPENEKPIDHPHLLVGSVGLYGLRRASLPQEGKEGLGLTSMFDITHVLVELFDVSSIPAREIRVTIVPNHQLSDVSAITIEHVSVFMNTMH